MTSWRSPTASRAARYTGRSIRSASVSGAASSVAPDSNSGTIRSIASRPPARERRDSFISSSTSSRSCGPSVCETT